MLSLLPDPIKKPDSFTVEEEFDSKNVKLIYQLYCNKVDSKSSFQFKILGEIIKKCKNNEDIIKFKSKFEKRHSLGRRYLKKGVIAGASMLEKQIRECVITNCQKDLDIVNCHANVLFNITKNLEEKSNNLKAYVLKREEMMIKHNFTKDDFNKMLNISNYNSNNKFLKKINKFIYGPFLRECKKKFDKEYNEIIINYKNENPDKDNWDGSFIHFVLEEYEQDIMYYVMEYLKNKNLKIGCYMYDGNYVYNDLDLNDLSKFIKNKLDWNIKFKFKELNKSLLNNIDIEELDKEYLNWKIEFEKYFFHIDLDDQIYYIQEDRIFQIIKFKEMIQNSNVLSKLYNINYFSKWLKDSSKVQYRKIDWLPPPMVCPDDVFNLWKGFQNDKKVFDINPKKRDEAIKRYKEHQLHLACGDLLHMEYRLQYKADIIQNPGRKSQVSIIHKGIGGSGKSFDISLDSKLFDKHHVYSSEKIENIFGKNNYLCDRRLVICGEEISPNFMSTHDSDLKNMITSDILTFEKKYENSIERHSSFRVILNSNKPNPINISEPRRYVVFCPKKLKKDEIKSLCKLLNDEESIWYIFQYLKNLEIRYNTPDDWSDNKPETIYKNEMKNNQLSYVFMYLTNICESYDRNTKKYGNDTLYSLFRNYCNINGISKTISSSQFWAEINAEENLKGFKKLNATTIEGKKQRGREIDFEELENSLKETDKYYY